MTPTPDSSPAFGMGGEAQTAAVSPPPFMGVRRTGEARDSPRQGKGWGQSAILSTSCPSLCAIFAFSIHLLLASPILVPASRDREPGLMSRWERGGGTARDRRATAWPSGRRPQVPALQDGPRGARRFIDGDSPGRNAGRGCGSGHSQTYQRGPGAAPSSLTRPRGSRLAACRGSHLTMRATGASPHPEARGGNRRLALILRREAGTAVSPSS